MTTAAAGGRGATRPAVAVAPAAEIRLRVDWPACRARGLCAELLPEWIALDEWGYPLVAGPVPAHLTTLAAEVVATCPHRALRLVERPPSG